MGLRARASIMFAFVLLMAAPQVWAGEIEALQISNFLLEVRGGRGDAAWHIQYGTQFRPAKFVTLSGPGSTAFFAHYNWLRRIDTDKGIVTGRWMFPGHAITNLRWKKNLLEVEVQEERSRDSRNVRIVDFDPGKAQAPPSNQLSSDISRSEGLRTFARNRPLKAGEAEKILPELENTVKRDALSPWLRIGLGYAYTVLGKANSEQTIDDALRTESAHFAELLDIANYLDEKNSRAAARRAFERGYAAMWKEGQDPRLTSLLLIPGSTIRPDTPPSSQRELMERAYATGPWVDGGARAWEIYGKALASSGDAQGSALWLERAKDARANGLLVTGDEVYYDSLAASLVATTFLAAGLLYIFVLYFRYRPQRLVRRAAEHAAGVSRPGFCNIEYWRRTERVAFLSIIAIAWFAEGVAGGALRASSDRSLGFFFELRSGNLLGVNSIEAVESRSVKGPERDLLLAIAYQRDGQQDNAMKLYQSLPQFAEGWNNRGVLLKNTGDREGSRRAFDQALQLRPDFPEAEWNLGKPARGEWVKYHAQYAPDQPMMAVPTRSQVLKAFGIKENTLSWTTVLKGPLDSDESLKNFVRPSMRVRNGLLILLAAGALVLPFIRPREVLLAPPRYQRVLELLFPGTARVWGVFGGLLLGATCYASSAVWPPMWSRLFSYMSFSRSFLLFPLPFNVTRRAAAEFSSPIPRFWWFLALLALNAVVVLLWKSRRK